MEARRLVTGLLLSLLLVVLATPTVDAQPARPELLRQANLVFVGTVQQVGQVAMSGVPRSPRTIVVRVDAIIDKPPAVSLALNDAVTVEVKDPSPFQPGVQATFYTVLWILGKGLALREVGHEIVPPTAARSEREARRTTHREVAEAREEVRNAELRARIQAADAVVVGRVKTIRPAADAAMAARPNVRISEHNPDWQEAIIEIESWIKGTQRTPDVVVRFPGTHDVAWVQYPKFRLGQEGTFLLRADRLSGAPPRAVLAGGPVEAFTAAAPGDVLPKSEALRVRALSTP
jgi:hypothetical protein